MQPEIYCPDLEIDISTPVLIPCKLTSYNVSYRNKGTTTAHSAYAIVTIDDPIQVLSSSIDVNVLEHNKFRIELGSIESGESGRFEIRTQLNCDVVPNKAHEATAHIFPDANCNPTNPAWDGSHLEVDVSCLQDSVEFIIENTGATTEDPIQFFIIEDDLIGHITTPLTIEANEKIIHRTKASDETFRIVTPQNNGHPGRSMPTVAIEGCEADNDNIFSTGFVTQYPEDDADAFRSVDVQENEMSGTNPFANNGFPKGRKDEKFIQPTTDLEYHIRFQNTSSRTIERIVLRDTLSSFLDPATLRVGVGSHPFTFEVYKDGILKVTFDNIMLPSRFVNEEASYGYIKFRIRQVENNKPGTVIHNKATLYFDEEIPQLAPNTFHTIESRIEYERKDVELCENQPHGGIYYQEDTIVRDTIKYEEYHEVSLSYLTILENSYAEIDTIIAKGASYNNVVYDYDTTITHILTAQNLCDSILTVNIMVDPTSTNEIPNLTEVNIFPNPTSDYSFIKFELTEPSTLGIRLINSLGQEIQQIRPNDFLQQGQYHIPIDGTALSPGTYHILFTSEKGNLTRKFLILNKR